MTAFKHAIVARDKPYEVDPARLDHFELGPGEPVDDAALIDDPGWTLYAIDPDTDRALLLRLPDGHDLTADAFAFVAQFTHAVSAAVVTIDRLISMADHVPRPDGIVHLFSTGRCGSTLASRIFAELDGVWSLSEPDAIGQLVPRRGEYGTDRMRTMLGAATRWSFRPVDGRTDRTCVLKYRSESLFDAADYLSAVPDSSALFLHRDLLGWVDSTYRFAQKQGVDVSPGSPEMRDVVWPILSAGAAADLVEDICDPMGADTPVEVVLAALWTLRIEAYQEAADAGLELHSFSYRDLNDDREATVASLLSVLAHDTPDNRRRALRAYEADSQRGTAGARDRSARALDDTQRGRVTSLASEHPRVARAVGQMASAP